MTHTPGAKVPCADNASLGVEDDKKRVGGKLGEDECGAAVIRHVSCADEECEINCRYYCCSQGLSISLIEEDKEEDDKGGEKSRKGKGDTPVTLPVSMMARTRVIQM